MGIGKREGILGAAGGDRGGGALAGGGDRLRRQLDAVEFVPRSLQGFEEEAVAGADVEDAPVFDAVGAQQTDQVFEVLALAGVKLKVLAVEVVINFRASSRARRWFRMAGAW